MQLSRRSENLRRGAQRPGGRCGLAILLTLGALLAACQSTPGGPGADLSAAESTYHNGEFSRQRAWRHLLALTEIGPRVAGTEGAARARDYIRAQLEELGLEVLELRSEISVKPGDDPVELVHLTGIIAGESSDTFMLAAPYDTHPSASSDLVGANEGASGPALLLELGRVLVARPLPYTVALTFLDGEALGEGASSGESSLRGSRELVRHLAAEGSLSTLRLAVFFNQVADSDLEIARDLRSHRMYREVFWQAAESLGHGAAFPRDRGFGSPTLAHLSFIDHGVRRVVAIADERFGGEYAPGTYWRTEQDTPRRCSAESLEVVATVTLEALGRIGTRLRRIDHFARSPLGEDTPGDLEASRDHPENAGNSKPELSIKALGESERQQQASQPPASP
jgi:glutaminyl-peptide cyclotransferase